MIDARARKFLEFLKDGRWRRKVGAAGSIGTVEACVHLGLVKRKLRRIKGKPGHFDGSFAISAKGRRSLRKGESPTREQMTRAVCQSTCTTFFCRHRR